MDIYIPKYKEIYVKEGNMGMSYGYYGEYRYRLRGPDGRIKQECDWKPNTLLNRGLLMLTDIGTYASGFQTMALGTSAAPVDITQNGLQGSFLGWPAYGQPVSNVNFGAPLYQQQFIKSYNSVQGNSTGTINEFILTHDTWSDPLAHASVRVALDDPIVKGDADDLVIQHRMTWYPEVNDITGQVDISGELFNYTARHTVIGKTIGTYPTRLVPLQSYIFTGNMSPITEAPTGVIYIDGGYGSASKTKYNGGDLANGYYAGMQFIWTVDCYSEGDVNLLAVNMATGTWNIGIGVQVGFSRDSDGTFLYKEDTHELMLDFRMYAKRYVP